MANPQPIQALLPQAQATLERPTQANPESIERARRWLSEGWTFTGAETADERHALENAFENAVQWFAHLLGGTAEPHWLVMVGVSGTGKTMLARRICEYLRNWGRTVFERTEGAKHRLDSPRRIYSYAQEGPLFAPWRTLLPVRDENRARYALAAKDWFLTIDELKSESGKRAMIDGQDGVQPETWEIRAVGNLFDDMLRKWRIITMNLTRAQLATFWDVRIASRLMRDGNVIVDLSDVTDYGLRRELAEKNRNEHHRTDS